MKKKISCTHTSREKKKNPSACLKGLKKKTLPNQSSPSPPKKLNGTHHSVDRTERTIHMDRDGTLDQGQTGLEPQFRNSRENFPTTSLKNY